MKVKVMVANKSHTEHAISICQMMEEAAIKRGTGIAKREPAYVQKKMVEGRAVIAFSEKQVIGFCYIESWENERFVANSGLIVHPDFRQTGVAKLIKSEIFNLSKQLFPKAKLFGITTSQAVMKINSDLGYKPVTFSELTNSEVFWKGCESCKNHDILQRTNRTMCLCTGMICDFKETPKKEKERHQAWQRFMAFVKKRTIKKKNTLEILKDEEESTTSI